MKVAALVRGQAFVTAFLVTLLAVFLVEAYQRLGFEARHQKDGLAVVVFLQTSLTDAQAQAWVEQLHQQDKEIESLVLTTKEQAYKKAAEDPTLAKSLLLLKENPQPATVVVRYSDQAWLQPVSPVERLKVLPSMGEIRWDPQTLSGWLSLQRWRRALRHLAMLLIALVGFWAFMGIYRALSLRLPLREIFLHVGWGLIGGSAAAAVWLATLRAAFEDSAMSLSSWLPLGAGVAGALACIGIRFSHDK